MEPTQHGFTSEEIQMVALLTADGKTTDEEALASILKTRQEASRRDRVSGVYGIVFSVITILVCGTFIWLQIEGGKIRIISAILLLCGFGFGVKFFFQSLGLIFQFAKKPGKI